MALILRNILSESGRRFHLELLAGAAGLDRVMKWVYVAEDYTTSDFLRGGELIITTGVISGGSAQWLMKFLHHMIQQDTCGLILNEGPYFRRSDITPEVLAYCEQIGYPLLLMPWRIHIYDITRYCYGRIFSDARRDETVSGALRALLDPDAPHEEALALLPDYRFPRTAPYYAAVLLPPQPQPPLVSDEDPLFGRLQAALSPLSCPWSLFSRAGVLVLICQTDSPALIRQACRQLLAVSGGGTARSAGIGGQVDRLDDLARSGWQALAAARLGRARALPLFRYQDMGFFRLLLELPDTAVLHAYIEEKLGPVRAYDTAHGTDLSETLRQYLLHNGNLQAVSEAVFCHRNTVRNRVTQLEELLGGSLEDAMTRFELLCAYLGEQYEAVCRPRTAAPGNFSQSLQTRT